MEYKIRNFMANFRWVYIFLIIFIIILIYIIHTNLFLKLESKIFMIMVSYIEIFIVETYYLLKKPNKFINGKLEILDCHNLQIILYQTMKYME